MPWKHLTYETYSNWQESNKFATRDIAKALDLSYGSVRGWSETRSPSGPNQTLLLDLMRTVAEPATRSLRHISDPIDLVRARFIATYSRLPKNALFLFNQTVQLLENNSWDWTELTGLSFTVPGVRPGTSKNYSNALLKNFTECGLLERRRAPGKGGSFLYILGEAFDNPSRAPSKFPLTMPVAPVASEMMPPTETTFSVETEKTTTDLIVKSEITSELKFFIRNQKEQNRAIEKVGQGLLAMLEHPVTQQDVRDLYGQILGCQMMGNQILGDLECGGEARIVADSYRETKERKKILLTTRS